MPKLIIPADLNKNDVIDNLTSTATDLPLSAAKGKELKDSIDALQIAPLANNLTTTSAGYALDARQGKALDDSKVNKSDIINNLTSTMTNAPLSAAQGKVLQDGKANASDVYSKTEAVAKADIVNNLTSTLTTAPLSANMGKTLNDNMTPSVSTGFTFEADVAGLYKQHFAFKQGKVVVLSCAFKITSNKSTYTKLATLPSGFWPTEEIEFISISYYGQGVYAMYITKQGELYCRNGVNATNMLVFNVTYIQA